MTTVTFTTTSVAGKSLQFINNTVTNNTGASIDLKGTTSTVVTIPNTSSASVTMYVNNITKGATNYYPSTTNAITAKSPVSITFTDGSIDVTY